MFPNRKRRLVCAAVVAAITVTGHEVAAEPTPAPDSPIHLRSPSTVTTDGGSTLRLPPSYVLDEPSWDLMDTEFRRLQDAETRLGAENKSLRDSASQWAPGWRFVLIVAATGVIAGTALEHWAF